MSLFLQNNIARKHRTYKKKDINALLSSLNDDKLASVDAGKIVRGIPKLSKLLGAVVAAYDAGRSFISKRYGIGEKEYAKVRKLIDLKRIGFKRLGKELSRGKRTYHLIFDNDVPSAVQVGGFSISDENASAVTKTLDVVQLILDVAGFAPGVGIVPDVVSMMLSLLRGDFYDAMCSAINVIPIVGSFVGTPMKYIRRYKKLKRIAGNRRDLKAFSPVNYYG